MPDLIKAASYAGLLFSGLGAIALAMIHASKFSDETSGDGTDAFGDIPTLPEDFKAFHARSISTEAQRNVTR